MSSSFFEQKVAEARRAVEEADKAGQRWLHSLDSSGASKKAELGTAVTSRNNPNIISDRTNGTVSDTALYLESAFANTGREEVLALYEDAYAKIREVVCADSRSVVRLPFLKRFYERTHEALTVFTVFKNVLEDVDKVRFWLVRQAKHGDNGDNGAAPPKLESFPDLIQLIVNASPSNVQTLIHHILSALYFHQDDRRMLARDPLCAVLLPDSNGPNRKLDFTIVTAMGVVTDGAGGEELKQSFERLKTAFGVDVVRADTGTARTLEFNASQIEKAVNSVKTKTYGWLGYSQGCANQWRAEATLLQGTPEQEAIVRRKLVTRNLLYSNSNGTPHGTSGEWKMSEVATSVELSLLKNLQMNLSENLISLSLSGLQALFATKSFVFVLGGLHTLNQMSCIRGLWLQSSHLADLPTIAIRAICRTSDTPDALRQFANQLTAQGRNVRKDRPAARDDRPADTTRERDHVNRERDGPGNDSELAIDSIPDTISSLPHGEHDTQVTAYEARSYPVYVTNKNGRTLRRSEIQNKTRRGHHWNPLTEAEVGFVTTDVDREEGVYDGPKDVHVFPWVMVNDRFGIIQERV